MKKSGFIAIIIFSTIKVWSQDASFFAKGFILNQNKDTSFCRIWFNPKMPFFNDEITIWQNEESRTILLNDTALLIPSFGISEPGYQINYDRIFIKPIKRSAYGVRLVDGILKVYVVPVLVIGKNSNSYALSYETGGAYFLQRSDDPNRTSPTPIKSLKKKSIAKFLDNYPGLDKLPENLTNTELVELATKFNTWFENKSR